MKLCIFQLASYKDGWQLLLQHWSINNKNIHNIVATVVVEPVKIYTPVSRCCSPKTKVDDNRSPNNNYLPGIKQGKYNLLFLFSEQQMLLNNGVKMPKNFRKTTLSTIGQVSRMKIISMQGKKICRSLSHFTI